MPSTTTTRPSGDEKAYARGCQERARVRAADELYRHLADMSELHGRVLDVRRSCGRADTELLSLADELARTLDEHHALIAERLATLDSPA